MKILFIIALEINLFNKKIFSLINAKNNSSKFPQISPK